MERRVAGAKLLGAVYTPSMRRDISNLESRVAGHALLARAKYVRIVGFHGQDGRVHMAEAAGPKGSLNTVDIRHVWATLQRGKPRNTVRRPVGDERGLMANTDRQSGIQPR